MFDYLAANQWAASGFGLSITTLLMVLVARCSTRDLRSYTRLLGLHTIADMVYVVISTAVAPRCTSLGQDLVVMTSGAFAGFSTFTDRLLLVLNSSGFIIELTLIPIDYYYRYVLLCHNVAFTNLRLAMCLLVCLLVMIIHFIVNILTIEFGPTPENEHLWALIRTELPMLPMKPWPFTVYRSENPSIAYGYALGFFNIVACYSIVIFCTLRIRSVLRANARRCARRESRRCAAQITRIMAFQAVLPFVVFCGPAILLCTTFLLNTKFANVDTVTCCLVQWLPSVKCAATIFIVRPYRRAVLRRFGSQLGGETTAASDLSADDDSTAPSNCKKPPALTVSTSDDTAEQVFL